MSTKTFSQSKVDSLLQGGNAHYRNKEYLKAARTWELAAEISEFNIEKNTNYSYAASAFAAAEDSINSLRCLNIAINKYGFNDVQSLNDESFLSLKNNLQFKILKSSIKPVFTTDPQEVKIINTDVLNFWNAYDLVKKDTANAEVIFKNQYINIGTPALHFYYANKIGSIKNFVKIQQLKKKYYASIRETTFKVNSQHSLYKKAFINLKKIYTDAIFPPVYFVIGRLNSGGTVCNEGLILGIDQACMSPDADTSELNAWQKKNISAFENLPHTVAHELIHFQQNGMGSDTTLLAAALKEGMADFIGEIISGKTANERLKKFATGREKKILADFKQEMFLNKADNWIANSDQETAEKPADLGYWVGYQICKAYYKEAKNKKNAIYDMLHIKDYKAFLSTSKLISF